MKTFKRFMAVVLAVLLVVPFSVFSVFADNEVGYEDNWNYVATDGTIAVNDGAIVVEANGTAQIVSKNVSDFDGASVTFNSTADNVSFALSNYPAPYAEPTVGGIAFYYGVLTSVQYPGEYTMNVTLSDGMDLGWTVLGVGGDDIYDVGTFTVISNGNFWGNKSNTTFDAAKGEDNTITFHNFYNEDDGGWELSYDVNDVYHYASDFTGAFDETDNYLDYTLIVGADGDFTVKEVCGVAAADFAGAKHECGAVGATIVDGAIVPNTCELCGKAAEVPTIANWDVYGTNGTAVSVDEGTITLDGAITKFVSKATSDMDGLSVTFNSTAKNVSVCLTDTPAAFADNTLGTAAFYFGVLRPVQEPGEHSFNVTLSDLVDLGWYAYPGTANDGIYDNATFTVVSNGNFWGNKTQAGFTAQEGEDITITFHNYYNEDDGGWELSYDVDGVYHYAPGFEGGYTGIKNFKDYTAIVAADGPLTLVAVDAAPAVDFAGHNTDAVALIGDYYYADLATAFAAANDGDTVYIVNDAEIAEQVIVDKAVTIELGDKTITSATNGLRFTADATINATEGAIAAGEGGSYWAVRADGCNLTINGGKYTVGADAANEGNNTIYATNGAAIVINDGYFATAAAYSNIYYVLNCKDNSGSTITVNGGKFENFEPGVTNVGAGEIIVHPCGVATEDNGVYTVAQDHNYDWVVTKEATCTAKGKQYFQCTVCGLRAVDEDGNNIPSESIPKTPHNYVHTFVNNALVDKCTACDKTTDFAIDDWDVIASDGAILTIGDNGEYIVTDSTITKFVSKQAYDFNGTSVDFSSTAANVSFLLTNTPDPNATAVIGTAASYYGILTPTQYAGEYSFNVTLSDVIDLGWYVYPGAANDGIYDEGTFTVISNGNFWGNKTATEIGVTMDEQHTITFNNFYNEDDGGWELSYAVDEDFVHYASDFTGAFEGLKNFNDYTIIVGADGPVTVYGFNAEKHTCEGEWTIDGIAFNNEFVCAKCGKLLDTANATSVDGRIFTVANVTDGSKDIFVISGSDYTTYAEVKAAKDTAAYYERQTNLKLTADGNYVFDELLPGNYVVLLRFADGTEIAKNFTIEGYNPTMTEDGRYITVTSEADYGYVFVIKGHYDSYAAIKADRDTAEYYFGYNGSKIVNNTVKAFVPTYGEEYTICSKTLDGTTTFKYVTVEEPTFVTVNATATGLTGLDNIAKVRYAAGEYTTDRDVKNANGAKVVVARDLNGATTYDFAETLVGTYTFSVTYTSGVVDVFTLTF